MKKMFFSESVAAELLPDLCTALQSKKKVAKRGDFIGDFPQARVPAEEHHCWGKISRLHLQEVNPEAKTLVWHFQ